MGAPNLAVVKEQTEKPKRKRDRIALIETLPKPDWFVCARERGRKVWYLRFCITGMLPRRFGPFKNRHRALLALDGMLNSLTDGISDLSESDRKYRIRRQFTQDWGAIIEDDLALPSRACRSPRMVATSNH